MPTPTPQGTVYSQRLGAIADDQFRRALARFNLGDFVRAAPTQGGLFGQNVFVTSTQGEFVLRGCPHWDFQFSKERFFAQTLHHKTAVPVPWPYLLEKSPEIFGWSYAFMPRLQGEVAALDRSPEDNRAIAKAMGENLAELQALTFPACGEYDLATDGIQPYPHGYEAWVMADVRGQMERCAKLGCLSAADAECIEKLLAVGAGAWADGFQPCFVQNDYGLNNVVVERTGPAWRVSGLFDLAECRAGDGESDFVRLLGQYLGQRPPCGRELAQAFLQSYCRRKPLRPGYNARFAVHTVRNALTFWEYGHSNAQWFAPDLTFQKWSEPFTWNLDAWLE